MAGLPEFSMQQGNNSKSPCPNSENTKKELLVLLHLFYQQYSESGIGRTDFCEYFHFIFLTVYV
jgi:hypothetical protein